MANCTYFGTVGKRFDKAVALVLDKLVDFVVTCIAHPQAANRTFLVSDGHDLSTTELVRGLARAAGVSARLLPVSVDEGLRRVVGTGDGLPRFARNDERAP